MNRREFLKYGACAAGGILVGKFAGKIFADVVTDSLNGQFDQEVSATVVFQATPDNLNKELIGFPKTVLFNSAYVGIYFEGKKEGYSDEINSLQGSGLLVARLSGYRVYLTARHVLRSSEDQNRPISNVWIKRPFINEDVIYKKDDVIAVSDDDKDVGIILVKDKFSNETFQTPVTSRWELSNKKFYAITFPGVMEKIGRDFVAFETTLYGTYSGHEKVVHLNSSVADGESGSVLVDDTGKLFAVITGRDLVWDNGLKEVSYANVIGDTLQKLINKAGLK